MTDDRSAFTEADNHEAWMLEKSPNWAKPDRSEFEAARTAGKAIHQQQRLDRATYTEAQVKALTKQAGEFGYALGRKEAREEIAALCEKRLTYTPNRGRRLELQELVAELRSKGDPS